MVTKRKSGRLKHSGSHCPDSCTNTVHFHHSITQCETFAGNRKFFFITLPYQRITYTSANNTGLLDLHQDNHFLQPFNGLFSRTTWVSRYQIGKTNLDFTGARDSEWQWHQLGHMQVCTSLQTDNHASTPPLCFLQAGCPSCRPTNSVKALKAQDLHQEKHKYEKPANKHIPCTMMLIDELRALFQKRDLDVIHITNKQ